MIMLMKRCQRCGSSTLAEASQDWVLCEGCARLRAIKAGALSLAVFLILVGLACLVGCANPATVQRLESASGQIEQSADYLEAWVDTSSKRQIELYKYIQSGAKFGPQDIQDGIEGVRAEQAKTVKPLTGLRRAADQVEIASEEANRSWTR